LLRDAASLFSHVFMKNVSVTVVRDVVIPAEAGIHSGINLEPRLRGNDGRATKELYAVPFTVSDF